MLLRKPVLEYYLRLTLRAMLWILLISVGATFLLGIGVLGTVNIGVATTENTVFTGMEPTFFIAMLIICMSDFKPEFHFMFQHGVSRRSTFVAFVCNVVAASAFFSATLYLATIVFSIAGGWFGLQADASLIHALYGPRLEVMGTLSTIALTLLFYWTMFIMAGVIGYFFAILFYKLSKFGKIILGGAAVVAATALPVINNLTGGRIWQFAVWLGQTFVGRGALPNPFNGIAVFAALSAIVLLPCWLMIRRCKLQK